QRRFGRVALAVGAIAVDAGRNYDVAARMCGVAWSAESISVRAVRIFCMRAHSDWLAASRQSGERLFHGSVLRRPEPDRDRLILFWWRKLPHFLCDSSSRARPCDADLPGRALDRGAT